MGSRHPALGHPYRPVIPVSLRTLVFVTLSALLGILFLLWLLAERRRSRREKAAFQNVLHCRLCFFDFRSDSPEPEVQCPRCGAITDHEPPFRV